jgi:hypothetical protein
MSVQCRVNTVKYSRLGIFGINLCFSDMHVSDMGKKGCSQHSITILTP